MDIGMVEINYQLTLSDLRILIKFEIDSEELPSQFRFLYKGSCHFDTYLFQYNSYF